MTAPLEIEVKFHVSDKQALLEKLHDIGAVSKGKVHEYNLCFDDDQKHLTREKRLLRLRKADKTTLTVKNPPDDNKTKPGMSIDFKVYEEIEVCVDDFDAMSSILRFLGFSPVQVYEKLRETFMLKNTVLCLDELPYGMFLEIEGLPDAIVKTAERLGLAWNERICATYLFMFETLRRILKIGFYDLTFENFSKVRVDFEKYRHLFIAGPS